MSAGERCTLADIETAIEESAGRRVIDRIANPTPCATGLPVRDLDGRLVAHVPEALAEGLLPIAKNGYVVGYYKDADGLSFYPLIDGGTAIGLVACPAGERWIPLFDSQGRYLAHGRVTLPL